MSAMAWGTCSMSAMAWGTCSMSAMAWGTCSMSAMAWGTCSMSAMALGTCNMSAVLWPGAHVVCLRTFMSILSLLFRKEAQVQKLQQEIEKQKKAAENTIGGMVNVETQGVDVYLLCVWPSCWLYRVFANESNGFEPE